MRLGMLRELLSPSGEIFRQNLRVKSFLLILITLIALIALVVSGGALFYLTKTAEYSRIEATPPPSSPGN